MNRAEEDYIKMIYELQDDTQKPYVKGTVLAEKFEYTLQSVNEMLKRLESKGYLSYVPYKGVQLTNEGKEEAIRLVRAHRIWETFLGDKLNLPWEKLHQEAEQLEHASSDLVIEKLYEYLKKPLYCKHGNPIPDQDGNIPKTYRMSIYECPKNNYFKICRVLDYAPLLKHLNILDIHLNDIVKVESFDTFTEVITLTKSKKKITMTKQVAQMIFGEVINDYALQSDKTKSH